MPHILLRGQREMVEAQIFCWGWKIMSREFCSNVVLTVWEIWCPNKAGRKRYSAIFFRPEFLSGQLENSRAHRPDHISVDGSPCVLQDRRLWQHAEFWRLQPSLLKDLLRQKHYCMTRPNLQDHFFISSYAGHQMICGINLIGIKYIRRNIPELLL